MNYKTTDYKTILKEELESRCNRNPRYSLRSFARDLGMSSARLSEVLNGKAGISRQRAEHISKHIGLGKNDMELFCDLVDSKHARSKIKKEIAKARLLKSKTPYYSQLQMDSFRVISDWYHFAILELTKVKGFIGTPVWISKALGITEMEAKLALERLFRLEQIKNENSKIVACEDFTASPSGVPSEYIKKFHQQVLRKAENALFMQPVEKGDFSTTVMAFDSTQINEARKIIKDFRRNFSAESGIKTETDSVYCLSVQFFELTENKAIMNGENK